MWFLILKTLHILSAIVLLGTGFGTAFHFWATHLRGDPRAIAAAASARLFPGDAPLVRARLAGLSRPCRGGLADGRPAGAVVMAFRRSADRSLS
jgi:uncharacterized membrane protein